MECGLGFPHMASYLCFPGEYYCPLFSFLTGCCHSLWKWFGSKIMWVLTVVLVRGVGQGQIARPLDGQPLESSFQQRSSR